MNAFCPTASRLSLLLLAGICTLPAAETPSVHRVEPPSWWAGHSWNPVRLLIEGRHLEGAHLAGSGGLVAGPVTVSSNGCWAFADLTIPAGARPGLRPLTLTTPAGSLSIPFELRRPPSAKRSFQGFSPDDVIYLAMPDRFANGCLANDDPPQSPGLLDRSKPRHYHGGDLEGARQRLPYLKGLGVTALWLTPWYDNVNHLNFLEKYTPDNQRSTNGIPSTDYHGYGATDFYGVEERFGDLPTLQRLVRDAHRQRIKIIQDQVANHTGPYHPWATNPPSPSWYNGTVTRHLENAWETWTIADPSAPEDKRRATLEGWFINLLPDLNQNDPETSRYLIQNSLWWLGQTGLDAVRQDTLPYVPRTHWSRWTAALKQEHPRLTVLGEMWDGNPKLVAFFQGGRAAFDGVDTGVDTLFDFPMCYAIRDVFAKNQPLTRISDTLAADTNYVDASVLVTFIGLHDMPRFLHETGADLQGLKQAFTCLLTMRGTPLIYYGDEIGMTGGGDPDNRRDFPGGFPGDANNAFEKAGRTPEQAAVFDHVQALLKLRRSLEPLRRGDYRVQQVTADTLLVRRAAGNQRAYLAFNRSSQPIALTVPLELDLPRGETLRERFPGRGRIKAVNGAFTLPLPPRSSAIYSH